MKKKASKPDIWKEIESITDSLFNEIGHVWLHRNQEINFTHGDYLKWVFQLTVTSWINPWGNLSLCYTILHK